MVNRRFRLRSWKRAQLLLRMLASLFICGTAPAQETREPDIVVNASTEEFEEPGGYGQPQWAERSRASSTTKLYVLSPYEVFVGILSESDFPSQGKSAHHLMQEIEVGLPYRFELGIENEAGVSGSEVSAPDITVAARYAFGKWGAIPLNPALSASYGFGISERIADASSQGDREPSDACEVRLLLGQEFIPRVQWASNLFLQEELSADRNRRVGFTQSLTYLLIADKLELGTEMRYTHQHRRGTRDEFVIGPNVSWKPNRHTVVSLAPLLGCTRDSPRMAAFVSASLEFGGGESKTTDGSTATRNR